MGGREGGREGEGEGERERERERERKRERERDKECVFPVGIAIGEHVATLGQTSSGVGMGWPAGIDIDEDGFGNVCDHWSPQNGVVVF